MYPSPKTVCKCTLLTFHLEAELDLWTSKNSYHLSSELTPFYVMIIIINVVILK